MNVDDFEVPPMSWAAIDQIAGSFRAQFGLADQPFFPIMEFLEDVLDHALMVIHFQVGTSEEMGSAEGYTDQGGTFIKLREDVYLDGLAGQGRARFTASHELGHFILHSGLPLARIQPGQQVKAYAKAEPQANQFASALLMPLRFMSLTDTPEIVAKRHGTSLEAARLRLEYMARAKRN